MSQDLPGLPCQGLFLLRGAEESTALGVPREYLGAGRGVQAARLGTRRALLLDEADGERGAAAEERKEHTGQAMGSAVAASGRGPGREEEGERARGSASGQGRVMRAGARGGKQAAAGSGAEAGGGTIAPGCRLAARGRQTAGSGAEARGCRRVQRWDQGTATAGARARETLVASGEWIAAERAGATREEAERWRAALQEGRNLCRAAFLLSDCQKL